jgi:CRISPR-associated protein Cas2
MSRRRYVVAYDIREAKRLRRVHATMKGYGYPLQYSVFVCDLDGMEKIAMREAVEHVMQLREDSLAVIDLGDVATRGVECFEFLGVAPLLPRGGAKIV